MHANVVFDRVVSELMQAGRDKGGEQKRNACAAEDSQGEARNCQVLQLQPDGPLCVPVSKESERGERQR